MDREPMSDLQAAIERVREDVIYADNERLSTARSRTDDLRAIVGAVEEAREVVGPFARLGELIMGYFEFKDRAVQVSEYGDHFIRARAFLAKLGARP